MDKSFDNRIKGNVTNADINESNSLSFSDWIPVNLILMYLLAYKYFPRAYEYQWYDLKGWNQMGMRKMDSLKMIWGGARKKPWLLL